MVREFASENSAVWKPDEIDFVVAEAGGHLGLLQGVLETFHAPLPAPRTVPAGRHYPSRAKPLTKMPPSVANVYSCGRNSRSRSARS